MNEWSRLVVTYDGSSRASGIRLYVNGTPVETDVVRDRLYKDISYRREAGDRSSDTHPLTIGARFRDSGFKNGLIDDLQVFDVCLTAAEVVRDHSTRSRATQPRSRTSSHGITRRTSLRSPRSRPSASRRTGSSPTFLKSW